MLGNRPRRHCGGSGARRRGWACAGRRIWPASCSEKVRHFRTTSRRTLEAAAGEAARGVACTGARRPMRQSEAGGALFGSPSWPAAALRSKGGSPARASIGQMRRCKSPISRRPRALFGGDREANSCRQTRAWPRWCRLLRLKIAVATAGKARPDEASPAEQRDPLFRAAQSNDGRWRMPTLGGLSCARARSMPGGVPWRLTSMSHSSWRFGRPMILRRPPPSRQSP